MLKRLLLTGPLVFAFALAIPAHADTITYTATLLGSNEVPPTGSPATGFATFTLNGNLLSIDETFTGLTTPASAAHIHCCGPVGVNEIVAVPFTPFPNTTSGTFIGYRRFDPRRHLHRGVHHPGRWNRCGQQKLALSPH